MKEYIIKEHPDFPYEEPKPPVLIRCEDCEYWEADDEERVMYCGEGVLPITEACMGYGYCSMAKPKDKEE